MRRRFRSLTALTFGLAVVGGPFLVAQPASSGPVSVYAHDLRVRPGGNPNFNKDTPKVGVEFIADSADEALLALSESGQLAVVAAGPLPAEKKVDWLFAHDLRARKADEAKFSPSTTRFGVEAFKDSGSGKILYASQAKAIALAELPTTVGKDKEPAWHHGLTLKVRGPEDKELKSPDVKKIGVEVFKDGNTGGLIYITETGSIATASAPATAPDKDKVKAPTALYGLAIPVRGADEDEFTKTTKELAVEISRDENTGGLIYVTIDGAIATAPAPAQLAKGKGLTWLRGMKLKARTGGSKDFDKATTYGIEVYKDNNTGNLLFVSSGGGLAVLPPKK